MHAWDHTDFEVGTDVRSRVDAAGCEELTFVIDAARTRMTAG